MVGWEGGLDLYFFVKKYFSIKFIFPPNLKDVAYNTFPLVLKKIRKKFKIIKGWKGDSRMIFNYPIPNILYKAKERKGRKPLYR